MKINVFLDDFRDPPYENFIVARDGETLLKILREQKGNVAILSLDHDLGNEDKYDGTKVVERMIIEGLYGDRIFLHTANPVGRYRMKAALDNAIKHQMIPDHVTISFGPIP